MGKLGRLSTKAAVVVAAPVLVVLSGAGTTGAAAPSCTAGDFTVDGEFDLDGYLACLAGGPATGGAGGTLPTTGSELARVLAIGAGLAAVGVGALFATKRDRRPVAESTV